MKLYIATHDDYDDQWGASICSIGVFDSYDKAEKALNNNGIDFFRLMKLIWIRLQTCILADI